jgi:hypothetical protein
MMPGAVLLQKSASQKRRAGTAMMVGSLNV